MTLADYLTENHEAIQAKLPKPLVDSCPASYSVNRSLYPAQRMAVAGTLALWEQQSFAWLVGAIGSGKTTMAITAIAEHKKHNLRRRTLLMCPGSLCKKWAREIELLTGEKVEVIRTWKHLLRLKQNQWTDGGKKSLPGYSAQPVRWDFRSCVQGHVEKSNCGNCQTRPTWVIVSRDWVKYGDYSPAYYIRKKLKRYFYYFVLDEAHEERNADSKQTQAAVRLAHSTRRHLLLTGSLTDGSQRVLQAMLSRFGGRGNSNHHSAGLWGNANAYELSSITRTETLRRETGSNGRASQKIRIATKPLPGIHPRFFMENIMPNAVFVSLEDCCDNLPQLTEEIVRIEPSTELKWHYDSLVKCYKKGRTTWGVQQILAYNDWPFMEEEIANQNQLLPKEQYLLDLVEREADQGRRTWIYLQYTGNQQLLDRLQYLLSARGLMGRVLTSDVPPEKREQWIQEHGPHVDYVISNPVLVQTGLDFFKHDMDYGTLSDNQFPYDYNFPTIVFYQTGYNPYTIRQAAGRHHRIGQTEECKTYYLCYKDTIQEKAIEVVKAKIAAGMEMEGHSGKDNARDMGSIEQELIKYLQESK